MTYFSIPSFLMAQVDGFVETDQVPKVVIQKMSLLYPEENNSDVMVKWEFEHGGYEAYIKLPSHEDVAFFTLDGKLVYRINIDEKGLRAGTEKEITTNDLPESILKQVGKSTIAVVIKELDVYDKTTGYRMISAKGQEFNYNAKGKVLIKK